MYKVITQRKGSRIPVILVALVCAVYLLCYTTVGFAATHKPGTLKVDAVAAEFIDCRGIDEAASSVSFEGNVVTIDIVGLSRPGAGAMTRITAKNTGTLAATLVSIDETAPEMDFLKLDMADVPIGKVMQPGDTCIFDVGVYWDPDRDEITSTFIDDKFQVILTYENDEMINPEPNPNPSPKTGDNSHTELFTIIAVICALVLVVCLILMIVGKKKKKEDETNEK